MADSDRLLEQFITAHRAGEDPDPGDYVGRVEGARRAELEALIDAYLARAPRREWDPGAFATSPARNVADAVSRSLAGSGGTWPVLLPRLRARARLRRDEVVHRLAAALGAPGREQKVGAYYHRMEQGRLPAAGVSQRVLEALGGIVGAGPDALRRAGEAVEPSLRREAADAVFARTATPDEGYAEERPGGDGEPAAGVASPAERDEIDELFTGG